MPILTLQRRAKELGRIRMGAKVETSSGKERPTKLDTWRLTSPEQAFLVALAEVYGGEVRVWEDAPTEGTQYELITESDTIEIGIPAEGEPLTQWMELWSGGGMKKQCDGQHQTLVDRKCSCPIADRAKMDEEAKKGQACSPVTRLSVYVKGTNVGVWRLETRSWNAAQELAWLFDVIRSTRNSGLVLSGRLRLESRTSKKDGKTHHYAVPVVTLDTVPMEGVPGVTLQIPEVQRKELPTGPGPGLPSDSTPAIETTAIETEAARQDSRPPLPDEGLPLWIRDLPGSDGDILDAAMAAAEAAGHPMHIESLDDLAALSLSAAAQTDVRERVLAIIAETDPNAAVAPEVAEQETLVT